MTEPRAVAVEEVVGHDHRWVDRPSVRDVEAEAGVGQRLEEGLELVGGAARVLPVVHVLKHEPGSKRAEDANVGQGIRVRDDGSDPDRELGQLLDELRLVQRLMLDGRMDADISEWQARLTSEVRDQSRQLVP